MPIHGYPGGVISSTAPTIAPTGASGVWTTETQLQNSANWPSADYITRSLRLNSADSAYLTRTPGSASNRRTWTWSGWLKRSAVGSGTFEVFTGAASSGGTTRFTGIRFIDDQLYIQDVNTASYNIWWVTPAVFRDPSAWYHFVVKYDTTEASSSNAVALWVNGVSQTLTFTFASGAYVQNREGYINATNGQYLGINQDSSGAVGVNYFSGYMADITFVDGLALTPSSFGAADPNTGEWQPQVYHGAYGTNGFYLRFANNTGTTSTTLGLDSSGNGNNWTPNNFSVTAGAGNDSLVDSPSSYGTDTGVGGEVRGNYATWNPLSSKGTRTLTNGNLDTSNSGDGNTYSNFEVNSGKWYFEATLTAFTGSTASVIIGLSATTNRNANNAQNLSPSVGYAADGGKLIDSVGSSYGASFTTNDVIGVALDIDGGSVTFYKNGSSQGAISKTFAGQGTGFWAIFTVAAAGAASNSWTLNAGQRPFAYTAPAGFKCLVDTNLATPTIGATLTTRADDYFNTVLYTGTGASQSITGVGFQPDFVWIKNRGAAYVPVLFDVVRGSSGGYFYKLFTSGTGSESQWGQGEYGAVTALNSDGFTVNSSNSDWNQTNASGSTYVAWNWKANGAGSSNTAGSITSTVSVNTTSGFSVVGYTGNATAGATVGHGLNVAPKFVILKSRSVSTNWYVWSVGLTSAEYEIYLNTTDAEGNPAFTFLYDAAPTATTFSLPTAGYGSNNSGATYVAYCFAPVAGYSAFGKYTGNGSSDGPFVYTGFRPAWVMIKRTNDTSSWNIVDVKRNTYNVMNSYLSANTSSAEDSTYSLIDSLSNGFKVRQSLDFINQNTGTFIYAAFAEFPFKFARAR